MTQTVNIKTNQKEIVKKLGRKAKRHIPEATKWGINNTSKKLKIYRLSIYAGHLKAVHLPQAKRLQYQQRIENLISLETYQANAKELSKANRSYDQLKEVLEFGQLQQRKHLPNY